MTENLADEFEHVGIPIKIIYDPHADDPRHNRDSIAVYVWGPDYSHLAEKNHDEFINLDHYDFREATQWTPVAKAARWLTLMDYHAIAVPFRIEDYGSNGSQAYLSDLDDDRCSGFVCIPRKAVTEELTAWPEWDPMEYIKADFGEFAAWIENEVYGWVAADGEDDEESCWGYYGDLEYARNEAKEAAEHIAKERLINEEPLDVAEVMASCG